MKKSVQYQQYHYQYTEKILQKEQWEHGKIVFIPQKDRETWNYHAIEDFYLVPVLDHCRYHRINIPESNIERISDKVKFIPKYCKISYHSLVDEALEAIKNLTTAVNKQNLNYYTLLKMKK